MASAVRYHGFEFGKTVACTAHPLAIGPSLNSSRALLSLGRGRVYLDLVGLPADAMIRSADMHELGAHSAGYKVTPFFVVEMGMQLRASA